MRPTSDIVAETNFTTSKSFYGEYTITLEGNNVTQTVYLLTLRSSS